MIASIILDIKVHGPRKIPGVWEPGSKGESMKKNDKRRRAEAFGTKIPPGRGRTGRDKVVPSAFDPETSVLRGTSFMGFGRDFNPARIDVKNGRIIRTRPMHYGDEGYGPDYLKPWRIEVRGQVLEPPSKTLISPLAVGFKKRVYSPNRIKYPLIRVDWDPGASATPRTGARANTEEYPGMRQPTSSPARY